jgi:hypothetical protein
MDKTDPYATRLEAFLREVKAALSELNEEVSGD